MARLENAEGLGDLQGQRPEWVASVVAVAIVVLAFGGMYLFNLDGWLINDDEGNFLYQAWQTTLGSHPYEDLFVSRWPIFIYAGAAWMKVFGVGVLPMRLFSVFLTLGTGAVVYLLASETLSREAGLVSMVVFMLNPDIFFHGRFFITEPLQLLLGTLGLLFFARGYRKANIVWFILSGLILAMASLATVLSALVVLGCALALVARLVREKRARRQTIKWGTALLAPYSVVFGVVVAFFLLRVPNFYWNVIGYNLAQGDVSTLSTRILQWLALVLGYLVTAGPLVALALSSIKRGSQGDPILAPFAWQIPTVLAFLFLSRALFFRLLVYLVPSLTVLMVAALEPLRRHRTLSRLYILVICAVILPWLTRDARYVVMRESDTMRVVRLIEQYTVSDDRVLSDYLELNFHAHRRSTYLGSEISHVAIRSGAITGAKLIKEIEAQGVKMVIIDVSPSTGHHMVSLSDYQEFRAYISGRFELALRFGLGLAVIVLVHITRVCIGSWLVSGGSAEGTV